jgi:hypothetical protein
MCNSVSTTRTLYYDISVQKWGEQIFSNDIRQRRFNVKLVLNDDGIEAVYIVTSKYLIIKSTQFIYYLIYKIEITGMYGLYVNF